MLFKFLEKKLVVNCFVDEDHDYVHEKAPIQPMYKFIPKWFKDIPNPHFSFEDMVFPMNIRGCAGVMNVITRGFVIPMWSDLGIRTDEMGYKYQFSDNQSVIQLHDNDQAPGFYENYFFTKLESPWLLQSDNDVLFNYSGCMWNSQEPTPYIVPHALSSFDYVSSGTNIFLLLEKKKQNIFIQFNTPMLHLIPLSERKVELKTEVLSNNEYLKLKKRVVTKVKFTKMYSSIKRMRQGKCPINTPFK